MKSNLLKSLIALLGFGGFTSCFIAAEYGCPHADFSVVVNAQDPKGEPVMGMKVSIVRGQTDTIALGLIERYEVNYDFAQDIIERLCEDAWDEVGEASDGWLDSAKRPELDKLNARILPIVREWLKEIHEEPSFYKVLPFKECTLAEALKLHQSKVVDSPKGGNNNQ